MLQKNYTASETHYLCDECSEAITNPLCPYCLTEEVEAWLTLYPNLKHEIKPHIDRYLHRGFMNFSTICIKCRNPSAFLCPYCFTNHVLISLKKINASKLILKEFFDFFNFDFDHTGYTHEAERLGVI
ncbi:MAG: hypothetical protein WC867_03415 [Candidatus Pacearchaeota archaeon]|jgi:hypothetical protein